MTRRALAVIVRLFQRWVQGVGPRPVFMQESLRQRGVTMACRLWARTKVLARKREQRPPCGATASLGEKGQHPISRHRLGRCVSSWFGIKNTHWRTKPGGARGRSAAGASAMRWPE